MARPYFEALKDIKCSDCGAQTTYYSNSDGTYRWYRNKVKGSGFWCKPCYQRFYRLRNSKQ